MRDEIRLPVFAPWSRWRKQTTLLRESAKSRSIWGILIMEWGRKWWDNEDETELLYCNILTTPPTHLKLKWVKEWRLFTVKKWRENGERMERDLSKAQCSKYSNVAKQETTSTNVQRGCVVWLLVARPLEGKLYRRKDKLGKSQL